MAGRGVKETRISRLVYVQSGSHSAVSSTSSSPSASSSAASKCPASLSKPSPGGDGSGGGGGEGDSDWSGGLGGGNGGRGGSGGGGGGGRGGGIGDDKLLGAGHERRKRSRSGSAKRSSTPHRDSKGSPSSAAPAPLANTSQFSRSMKKPGRVACSGGECDDDGLRLEMERGDREDGKDGIVVGGTGANNVDGWDSSRHGAHRSKNIGGGDNSAGDAAVNTRRSIEPIFFVRLLAGVVMRSKQWVKKRRRRSDAEPTKESRSADAQNCDETAGFRTRVSRLWGGFSESFVRS